jgi:glycosyltransferase involved in cell wall biosynthesis
VTEISVVIPTRGRSGYLRFALRSVLWQRDVEMEVIVVDDASTDDTSEVVVRFGEPRIRLIRLEKSGGVSAARNRGAAEASGRWLAFLDDDDVWAPDKLASQRAAATTSGRTWAYTGWVTVDDKLRIISGGRPPPPEQVARLLFRRNAIPTGGSNVLIEREAFDRAGAFDPQLANGEDWDMWIRLARQGLPAWVPEPLMAYRIHPANASLDIGSVWSAVALIERQHRTKVDRGSIERWIAESCLRTGLRGEAIKYLALATTHGHGREVASDVLAVLGRRLDRYLGRPPRTLQPKSDPEWSARARTWLESLAPPLSRIP